jgi:hypothetical protein
VDLPRKTKKDKRVYINLNTYRNLHFILSNQAKKLYKEIITPQFEGLKFDKIKLHFKLFKKTKMRSDKANFIAIQEKFVCDAMVELGVIEDDNDDFIIEQHYYKTERDKENPRVEMIIEPVK